MSCPSLSQFGLWTQLNRVILTGRFTLLRRLVVDYVEIETAATNVAVLAPDPLTVVTDTGTPHARTLART